ncbi:hypothetical protein FRC15_005750 [Serendipita sp. 397]|nr:hypothetical protein FRC15_005750 [Serendipita sp. 397]
MISFTPALFVFLAAAVSLVSAQDAQVANAMPTAAPSEDAYLSTMPYDWMQTQGYSSVGCGYGYTKDTSGRCQRENWYTFTGCYQTSTIIRENCGAPATVTKTFTRTKEVTETPMPTTVFVTSTKTKTETKVVDMTEFVTRTEELLTTQLATETEDRTRTVTKTKSKLVTENQTLVQTRTNFLTRTQEVLVTYVQTIPTTIFETYLSTKTIDSTKFETVTATRSITSDVIVTRTRTENETATVTQLREVANTQLSDCLNRCKGSYWNSWTPSQQQHQQAQPSYAAQPSYSGY